ncbi:FBLN1 protein, partial [Polyodon spathula]|nr:FBLN1 protein [Polyodon spathula]
MAHRAAVTSVADRAPVFLQWILQICVILWRYRSGGLTVDPDDRLAGGRMLQFPFPESVGGFASVNAQISLDDCCANGQEWTGKRQDCAALQIISDSQMCRIAQEQCCIAAQDDNYCTTGVNLAKQHGECESLFTDTTSCEAKNIKRCCNCCLLGKKAQQQGLSCEQNLSLGYECGLVYRACCVVGQEARSTLPIVQPPQGLFWAAVFMGQIAFAICHLPFPYCIFKANSAVWIPLCAIHNKLWQSVQSGYKSHRQLLSGARVFYRIMTMSRALNNNCWSDTAECITRNCNSRPYLSNSHSPCTTEITQTQTKESCFHIQLKEYHRHLQSFLRCYYINECLLGSHNCRSGERCINTKESFRCQREVSCGTGYELTDSNSCQDIDECETGTHNCAPEFACQNTQGSFRCKPLMQCGDGFIREAQGSCIDINECMSVNGPCPSGQVCINTVGSFSCQRNSITCSRGYHLNEDRTRCVDVDECTSLSQPCGPGHGCINVAGTFLCECSAGYYFDSISRSCVDTNECRRYQGRLCAHKCENTPGSYHCSCTTGFKLGSDGRNCEDLNECESNPCSQECANVYGSYQCYCRRGYQLSDVNGITCEDIDECAVPTGGHICSYRCHNVPGSFHCTCPATGYTLAPNGRSCQDIDECVTGAHNCTGSETCFNVQGDFKCLLFECPDNYRKYGEAVQVDRTETIRCIKSCGLNDVNCVLDPIHTVSYTVISLHTFREFNTPEEIIFLKAMSPAHATIQSDIVFDITEGNVRNSFDIIKRFESGMTVGVVRQVRPLVGPLHVVLKLAMNYVIRGVVSHRNLVNIHIYISEYWF